MDEERRQVEEDLARKLEELVSMAFGLVWFYYRPM